VWGDAIASGVVGGAAALLCAPALLCAAALMCFATAVIPGSRRGRLGAA